MKGTGTSSVTSRERNKLNPTIPATGTTNPSFWVLFKDAAQLLKAQILTNTIHSAKKFFFLHSMYTSLGYNAQKASAHYAHWRAHYIAQYHADTLAQAMGKIRKIDLDTYLTQEGVDITFKASNLRYTEQSSENAPGHKHTET